jgi:hypothetical protein
MVALPTKNSGARVGALLVITCGAPDEVVRWPASRRVAELVGYLGFVPRPGPDKGQVGGPAPVQMPETGDMREDAVAGVHPERVIPGAHPGRGLVLTGKVAGCRPAGAGWEADLTAGDAVVVCRLPGRPAAVGGELAVTAVGPPWFGPDGAAIASPGWPAASEQART